MVFSTIGLTTRGESSMVSSMSGGGGPVVVTTALERGESRVSSTSGHGIGNNNGAYYWNGESHGGGGSGSGSETRHNDISVEDDVNNKNIDMDVDDIDDVLSNTMFRYSPSTPNTPIRLCLFSRGVFIIKFLLAPASIIHTN